MSEFVATRQKKKWKVVVRTFLASLVAILVVLVAITAGAAFWIQTSAFNSEAVAADAKVFLRDPAVNKEVAKFLTETAVDLGDQIRESSRDRNLGRVVSRALTEEKIAPLAESIAASQPVIESLATLVEGAHRQMLNIAKGDVAEPIDVSLNLVPVVVSVLDEMKNEKLIPEVVKLPELTVGATPEEDIAVFAKAFKMKLKDDFGQLKIVNKAKDEAVDGKQPNGEQGNGDTDKSENNGMAFSDLDGKLASASTGVLAVFVLLFVLLAVVLFLAPTRRSGFRISAGALLIASLVSFEAVRNGPTRLEDSIDKETDAKVIRAIVDAMLSSYVTLTTVMLVVSMLLIGGSIWGPALLKRVGSRSDT